jgi:hypothetical protein
MPEWVARSFDRSAMGLLSDSTLITFVLAGLVASALLFALVALRNRRPVVGEIVCNTHVLVCSLRAAARPDLDADARVYSSFYRRVVVSKVLSVHDLLKVVGAGDYDLVHLLSDVDESGGLVDGEGGRADGGDLLEACRKGDVKLLMLASDNPTDNYVKAFHKSKEPPGLKLHLVITLARNGEKFTRFLEALLRQVSNAKSLPQAWVALAPQTHAGAHGDLPETMLFAGRGGVELLP